MDVYLIVAIVFIAYFALIIVLWRTGLAKRLNISFMGPMILLRTERGRGAIRRIARARRFWVAYGKASRVLFLVGMTAMLVLLLWESTLVFNIPKQNLPSPQTYLLLPGINPFVPLWYGLLGIVVAVVLHEFAHGILSEAQDIDVKSMGVLLFIVPVGAFVEPEQQQLESVEPGKRVRVFGAGPGTNMVIAAVCVLLFLGPFMGSVTPVHDGMSVVSVAGNSSASLAGIRPWSEVVSINGTNVTTSSELNSITGLDPGAAYPVVYLQDGKYKTGQVMAGIVIAGTVQGSPAALSGVATGWVIRSMNNTVIYNQNILQATFNGTVPGQTVPFVFVANDGSTIYRNITMSSEKAVEGVSTGGKQIGFLGIYSSYMGLSVVPVSSVVGVLRDPFYGASTPDGYISSGLQFLVLPFAGLSPVPDGLAANLNVGGITGGSQLFWIGANSMYWLFWINLWVGLFNMLPAIPLDGGYLFKDNIKLLLNRTSRKRTEESREKVARGITNIFSFLILFLILWQIIGPRLV